MTSTRSTFMPLGGCGNASNCYGGARNVDQHSLIFQIEMLVIADVGIEIRAPCFHRHLAEQARLRELVHRVVDRGERNPHAGLMSLFVQAFGGHMAIAVAE